MKYLEGFLAIVGAAYLLSGIFKIIAFVWKEKDLGKKLTRLKQNTALYREYEHHSFVKFHSKNWETFDEEKLDIMEALLTRNPRFKRNKYTPEYLARVRELQEKLKAKQLEEWNP